MRRAVVDAGTSVDAIAGLALTVDLLDNAEATTLTQWVEEPATVVGTAVLVSDDAGTSKMATDDTVLDHQICKVHVVCTTEAWVKGIASALPADVNGSLAAPGVTPVPAVATAKALLKAMNGRDPTPKAVATLQALHCYCGKTGPLHPGEPAMLAYWLRLICLDRWNLWPRLTCYWEWTGPTAERLDGTNNGCERAIG